MAQGTLTVFNEAKENFSGMIDLSTGNFSCILINTLPLASQTTPDSADFTEVANGGGYTTGGIALTTAWASIASGGRFTSSTNPSWSSSAGSPTDIVAALIHSTDAVAEDAIAFIDMTADSGVSPVSLVDGPITITFTNPLFDLT